MRRANAAPSAKRRGRDGGARRRGGRGCRGHPANTEAEASARRRGIGRPRWRSKDRVAHTCLFRCASRRSAWLHHHRYDGGWVEVICGRCSAARQRLIRRVKRAEIARQQVQMFNRPSTSATIRTSDLTQRGGVRGCRRGPAPEILSLPNRYGRGRHRRGSSLTQSRTSAGNQPIQAAVDLAG